MLNWFYFIYVSCLCFLAWHTNNILNILKYRNLNRIIAAILLTYICQDYIIAGFAIKVFEKKNSVLSVNRQTNIYPSSIERELKRQQSTRASESVSVISQISLIQVQTRMPQLKYGLGFSHQDVNEKIRKVSGNKGDSEPVIRTKTEECSRSQGQVTDARQKFRKLGQSLLKRSNATQPPPSDASSRDQSSSACGNERPKVKSVSPEPASKRKHSSSTFRKGKKDFLWGGNAKYHQNERRHWQN